MTTTLAIDAFGVLTEPTTLRLQRLLPGPIERVWDHLTRSELRRQWLAAGDMAQQAGAAFELVWRNDELTEPPGERPAGFDAEHRMVSRVVTCRPPEQLVFTWGAEGQVSFDLVPQGDEVLLTVTHRRVTERSVLLNVSAGWHAHLDLLAARLSGQAAWPHWDHWRRLRQDYDRRLPA